MKPGALFLSTRAAASTTKTRCWPRWTAAIWRARGWTWRVEPPSPASRLLQHPNVASAFHTGGVTHEGRRKVAAGSARQISQMLAGVRPERLLNPYVWPRFLNGWRARTDRLTAKAQALVVDGRRRSPDFDARPPSAIVQFLDDTPASPCPTPAITYTGNCDAA